MTCSIPGFELLEQRGEGATGEVFRARQVALKVLRSHTEVTPELERRFAREARLQAALSLPELVRVLDAGTGGGHRWLALELVRGATRASWIDSRGPLPPAQLTSILGDLARGRAHLHEHAIIHRDLKPGSALIAKDETAKLGDFGLARRHGQTAVTAVGTLLGPNRRATPPGRSRARRAWCAAARGTAGPMG